MIIGICDDKTALIDADPSKLCSCASSGTVDAEDWQRRTGSQNFPLNGFNATQMCNAQLKH